VENVVGRTWKRIIEKRANPCKTVKSEVGGIDEKMG
jgi:hypothetical protein